MKILALETSCERASVALMRDGEIFERTLPGTGASHSSHILPAIRSLLNEQNMRVADCDVIAFGAGPGSFTGVRLACGVAQGFALGADKPVAPVDSLLALAEPVNAPHIYCAMDARMNEAYIASYSRQNGNLVLMQEHVCVPPAEVPVPEQGIQWMGVGSAFAAYADSLLPRMEGFLSATDAQVVPTAAAVARLACDSNRWCDPALAAPFYVRNRVALTIAERLQQGGKA